MKIILNVNIWSKFEIFIEFILLLIVYNFLYLFYVVFGKYVYRIYYVELLINIGYKDFWLVFDLYLLN